MKRHPHSVPASCFEKFSKRDFLFLAETVFGDEDALESLLTLIDDSDSLLAFLEQDIVFRKVIEIPFPLSLTPEFYFFILVRRSLVDAGINDFRIADYVAATLADHSRGRNFSLRSPGRPDLDFTYHVDFVEALDGLSTYERFFLQVECGNQFLALTGLFPKFLEGRANRRGAPSRSYYENVARSAFLTAGDHPLADEFDLRHLYPQLADCLDVTTKALNRMAENYLFLDS
ncbi:MAG: hypothetical protein MI807_11535 [Verrucomicrobiales bacterium]|nr:hypothetical protein [Verrucomicrobiales bacterium]